MNWAFNQVIRLLCSHALIEPNGLPNGYSMHGCIHAWTQHVLSCGKDTAMAMLVFRCVASAVPPEEVPIR